MMGMLEKDVNPPLEDDATPLTRIVVHYLPDEETFAKHPRDDDDSDVWQHVKRSKKTSRDDKPDGSGRGPIYCMNGVDAISK